MPHLIDGTWTYALDEPRDLQRTIAKQLSTIYSPKHRSIPDIPEARGYLTHQKINKYDAFERTIIFTRHKWNHSWQGGMPVVMAMMWNIVSLWQLCDTSGSHSKGVIPCVVMATKTYLAYSCQRCHTSCNRGNYMIPTVAITTRQYLA